ncbi:MAG: hypothetical protein KJP25_02195, partial [Gammaproteobacteria bacterium]|nr:hypothetical protein [Gammaproteobacteria bacterium]
FQIEAPLCDPANTLCPDENNPPTLWIADAAHPEFAGKTITSLGDPPSPSPSGHATAVGRYFYGLTLSMSPGITDIGAYNVDSWFLDYLFPNGLVLAVPAPTSYRVANHSWVGTGGSDPAQTSTALRHADWVSDVDELAQVYGANNGGNRVYFATALNGIIAGITAGTSANGVIALDDIYVAGRPALHLVAPVANTSTAAGVISSATALLMDAVNQNPSWSDASSSNRAGVLIYNAERVETLKAALMAGASRLTINTSAQGDINDYRALPANRTVNGLDWRYGAGQLNVLQSYQVLAAGESSSMEDDSGSTNLGFTGFDHDESFGGAGGSNVVATYDLGMSNAKMELGVALVWHLSVVGAPIRGNPVNFDETAVLHNLDLELVDVSNGNTVIAASNSSIDNTENIWQTLQPDTHYQLRVTRAAGQGDFEWDYSIAWAASPIPIINNIPMPLWMLGVLGLGLAGICHRVIVNRHHRG